MHLATNSHQDRKGIYHLRFLSSEDTASYYNRSVFLGVSLRQEGAGSWLVESFYESHRWKDLKMERENLASNCHLFPLMCWGRLNIRECKRRIKRMLIHYFQDNQSILEVSQFFVIQKEKFEMIQKQSCHPNSSCTWPLAVKTETEDKGKMRSSTGKQITAEPDRDGLHKEFQLL